MKKSISILLLVLILVNACDSAAQGYKIDIKVKNAQNLDAQFAYYQGDKRYIVQKGKFDKKGSVIFEGEEKLPPGIYFVTVGRMGFFDVLVRNEQNFSMKSDTLALITSMKINGSTDNELFYAYQKEVFKRKDVLKEIDSRIKKLEKNNDSTALYKAQKDSIQKELQNLVATSRKEHPDSYLAKILHTMYLPNVDEFNFADKDLLRTPFFHNMVRLFIKKNIEKHSEYIKQQTKELLEKVKPSEDNYKYICTYLLDFYSTFYKTGMNDVFVFLADNYFLPDKADWFNEKQMEMVKKRRDYLAQGLPGQPAQDITMEGIDGEFYSLLQTEANLVLLYFWSADCGHCTESTKIINEHYEQLKEKNVEVFAVNIDTDKKKWLKKIEETGTEWINCYDPEGTSEYREKYYVFGSPLLYAIDTKKQIIVTKTNGEDLIEKLVKNILKIE